MLPPGEYCVRFYYFLYGPDIHKLRLNNRVNGRDTVMESIEGNQGAMWHKYAGDFTMKTNFQVSRNDFVNLILH